MEYNVYAKNNILKYPRFLGTCKYQEIQHEYENEPEENEYLIWVKADNDPYKKALDKGRSTYQLDFLGIDGRPESPEKQIQANSLMDAANKYFASVGYIVSEMTFAKSKHELLVSQPDFTAGTWRIVKMH